MATYKLTTQEVLERCDIQSGKTLTRWRKLGLIPPPSLDVHPNGRGKVAYYPTWVCDLILAIKNRLAAGESLKEIARTSPSDWAAEEKRQVEKETQVRALWERSCRTVAARKFAMRCTEVVYTYLQRLGIQRPGIGDVLAKAFAYPELTNTALKLLLDSYSPVIVLLGGTIQVVPDFYVTRLCHPRSYGRPMLVIPIRELLVEEFSSIEPELLKVGRASSMRRVRETANSKKPISTYKRRVCWVSAPK